MQRDRGSILLFVLFTILILTALVYQIFTPYRQTVDETQALWVRDRGLSYLYSLENIAQNLVPRIDLNFYRQIKRVPAGEPVEIMLPVPEGITKAQLFSENNCLNITLDTPLDERQRQGLAQLLSRLSSIVLHETDSGKLIIDVLYPPARTGDNFLPQSNLFALKEDSQPPPIPRRLSSPQQKSLAALGPYLCKRSAPGQYIDINAIDMRSLVVLQTVLPKEIQRVELEHLYLKRGNNYWSNIDKFVNQLPHPELITSDVKAYLHTESQAFKMKFTLDSQSGSFTATTHFSLSNQKLTIARRDIITGDNL